MSKSNVFRKRLNVFIRDNWHCRFCGQDLLADEQSLRLATIDHLIPTNLGGNNDQDNLVTCCWLCNQAKGDIPIMNIADARKLIRRRRQAILAHMVEELHRAGQFFPRRSQVHAMQPLTITVDQAASPSDGSVRPLH